MGARSITPIWVAEPSMFNEDYCGGQWEDRRWMNTPGPIYTGKADFAFLGVVAAPQHVAIDDTGVDVVFRQPLTATEFNALRIAARDDPFDGYACDGNSHWTVDAVREWWSRVDQLRCHITDSLLSPAPTHWEFAIPLLHKAGAAWLEFLANDAQSFLRAYCFYLDNRRWPGDHEVLPEL